METKEIVTLVCTLIAATASMLNLLSNRGAERRGAQRRALEPHVLDLGEAVNEIVATSNMLPRAKSEAALKNWRQRAQRAKGKLQGLRTKLRYVLWGLDRGLRTLSRLPDWIEHARAAPEFVPDLLRRGDRLGRAIDRSVRRTYVYGASPSPIERVRVWWCDYRLRGTYARFQNREERFTRRETIRREYALLRGRSLPETRAAPRGEERPALAPAE